MPKTHEKKEPKPAFEGDDIPALIYYSFAIESGNSPCASIHGPYYFAESQLREICEFIRRKTPLVAAGLDEFTPLEKWAIQILTKDIPREKK